LADGQKYFIVKEKSGYVLKKGLNESINEYVEPMKHRKFYSSYSQALKRLNIITKEINSVEGVKKNVSLFTEGEEGEKKYFLRMKRNTNEQAPPAEQTPAAPPPAAAAPAAPAPAPVAADASTLPPPSDTSTEPTDTETMDMGTEEMPSDDSEMGTDDETSTEKGEGETVTFKTIQKITGKLAQKLRAFSSDEENEMSSKDIKYVINSILSAIDLDKLDEDDKGVIINKLEGEEDEEGGSDEDEMGDEDLEDTETSDEEGEEMKPAAPPAPETQEVPEYYSSIYEEDEMFDEYTEEYDSDLYERHGMKGFQRNESSKMEEMIENIFNESKVDKVLKKYFSVKKNELRTTPKKKVGKIIDHLSENIVQNVAAKKLLNEYRTVKFLGKNKNKDLIFSFANTKYTVDKNGDVFI